MRFRALRVFSPIFSFSFWNLDMSGLRVHGEAYVRLSCILLVSTLAIWQRRRKLKFVARFFE